MLFAFVPADATAQQKAVYKWGERALITSLGGQARIPWREHWSDLKPLDELAASLESAPESPDQGATSEAVPMTRPLGGFGSGPSHVDEGETYENPDDKFERMWANRWMLTDVERMSLEGEREARARNAAYKARKEAMQAEASSSVPAAAAPIPAPPASLKFPLTNTALSAAETFIGGGNSGFVLAIEEEVLVLRETIHKTQTMDGLREQLENEPCFVLFHWEHEWQGERRQATLFMFVRPEDAPLRQKMMHASSMRPLVTNLQAKGVEITKVITRPFQDHPSVGHSAVVAASPPPAPACLEPDAFTHPPCDSDSRVLHSSSLLCAPRSSMGWSSMRSTTPSFVSNCTSTSEKCESVVTKRQTCTLCCART